jgi:hypothetical protein
LKAGKLLRLLLWIASREKVTTVPKLRPQIQKRRNGNVALISRLVWLVWVVLDLAWLRRCWARSPQSEDLLERRFQTPRSQNPLRNRNELCPFPNLSNLLK